MDRGRRQIEEKLQQLTQGTSQESSHPETQPLGCPHCGGAMEVRFVGDLRDKCAACQYCGTELDLPDTYQQVRRQQEREKRPWGTRTVETTVIETRSDRAGGRPDGPVPESVDEWLEERGVSIPRASSNRGSRNAVGWLSSAPDLTEAG